MLHPIFTNTRLIVLYLSCWIILLVIQAGIIHEIADISLSSSIIDSLVYNFILAILNLSFWFPLAYADKSRSRLNMLLNNIGVYVMYVIIWILISYHLTNWILAGDLDYLIFTHQILPIRVLWGSLLFLLLAMLYHLYDFYYSLEEKKTQEETLKKLIKEAELKALKAQLNPHFLFNSLNSISALTITDPDKAREMLNKLSDFLRYSLRNTDSTLLPLKEELQNMRRYLEIEKVRFDDRLNCEFELSETCPECILPAMILQPIYENAVKHGVYESIDPVTIRTYCQQNDNCLEISVINNYDPDYIQKKGEGMGLDNIRNRLRMIYHQDNLLKINRENHYFEITLTIPQTA